MQVKFLKNYNFYLNELPAKMYSVKNGDVMNIADEEKVKKWVGHGVCEVVKEAPQVENKMLSDVKVETKKATKKK
jgi:hypothetical protein